MQTKYQIFVSSTYEDLQKQREQVIRAVLELGHIPVGMEMFSAGDEEQWRLIQRQIDQTDYYVVIVAHRYGSMDGEISYTEKEYDYATKIGVPVLGFIIDDSVSWPPEYIDKDPLPLTKLVSFKEKLKKKMVSFWTNADDLWGKCSIALVKAMNTHPRAGWIRADAAAGPEVTKELTRLSIENAEFRKRLEEQSKSEEQEERRREEETIMTLSINKRQVYVWLAEAKDWGEPIDSTLLEIFGIIARDLISEASWQDLEASIAFEMGKGASYRSRAPVPNNLMKEWLSDFVSLGLIQPSTKRHSVHDKGEYWMLTDFGRELYRNLRKVALRRGLKGETTPEEEKEGN